MSNKPAHRPALLWFYILVFVLAGTGTNLALRLLLTKMHAYQFFVVQSACCMYIPFTASLLIVDAFRKRLRFRVILNREVNKRFVFMAFLDCIANFLVVFGAAHTNLAFQTLVPQAVIPVSMLMGWLLLGSSFTLWQITGSVVVMIGVGVVCVPIIFSSNATLPQDIVFWTSMLFLSNFPMALSALVKELMLHHRSRDVPVSYLNTTVSLLQLLIGFVLAPFGLAGVAPDQITAQLRDGFHCLVGSAGAVGLCDYPEGSLPEYITFCALMFTMNISLLFVVRYGSSSIMYAASALVLPLSNLANTSSVFMGAAASPLDPYTLAGLVPILIGILMYANAKGEEMKKTTPAPSVSYPVADVSGLVGPGEKFYPMERGQSSTDYGILFDLDMLIPPRGIIGSAGVVPWMPIEEEKSLLARWAVTAHVRGDLVSPLLRRRRRHSSPPSPHVDEIAMSPNARGHGIWIPGAQDETGGDKKDGFYEWGMQVQH
jgi:drug/metabolite transporter (DMT)-like permease